jgi:glycerol-3-phosphate O-acyltransferase
MPTALVGTILLTLRGRGIGKAELTRKVNWLKREIIQRGGRIGEFGNMSTTEVVEKTASVLNKLIGIRSDLMEPVYYPLQSFELSFYRNQVIHLFISEGTDQDH